MKKLLLGIILLTSAIVDPIPAMARVDVSIGIGIPLPPPVVFPAPPDVIVMPDTNYVYVIPDIDADMFFWYGLWWRLLDGRWYRSRYYDRGWVYYDRVPSFYFDIDPRWRQHYRNHNWYGHRWNYERIPTRRLQQNWGSWQNNRYWERHGTWGVQSYKPRPPQQRQELRHLRQQQYQHRPEIQRPQQRYPQPWGQQNIEKSQHQKSRGKPEREDRGHRR